VVVIRGKVFIFDFEFRAAGQVSRFEKIRRSVTKMSMTPLDDLDFPNHTVATTCSDFFESLHPWRIPNEEAFCVRGDSRLRVFRER
jgi:hypothetical protein